jgi:hypothetical protein
MWDDEIERTKAHAVRVNNVIEKITEQLSHYTYENSGDRLNVALPLLKASIDIAAAATRLLTLDPVQYGGAAEAMFRPQLERYLRAVYFASPNLTTDEQVREFLDEDKFKVKFDDLTKCVAAELVRQIGRPNDPLAAAFAAIVLFEKQDLHGAVHGGRLVVLRYLNEWVAYNPWPLSHGAQVEAMFRLCILAYCQAAYIHGSDLLVTPEFAQALNDATPDFAELIANGRPAD